MRPVDMFRTWLDSARIEYTVTVTSDGTTFEIESGYIGFVSIIGFDLNGDLVSINAFE